MKQIKSTLLKHLFTILIFTQFLLYQCYSSEYEEELTGTFSLLNLAVKNNNQFLKEGEDWRSPQNYFQILSDIHYQIPYAFTYLETLKKERQKNFIELNLVTRFTYSSLYEKPYLATSLLKTPPKFVTRESIDLTKNNDNKKKAQFDFGLNNLHSQMEGKNFRLGVGRFFISYGQGEIFNPINPFNYPLLLSPSIPIVQGNDGSHLTLFLTKDLRSHFYLLFSKYLEDQFNISFINKTDIEISSNFTFSLIGGYDLDRFKIGSEALLTLEDGPLIFLQLFYQDYQKSKKYREQFRQNSPLIPSSHLPSDQTYFDFLLGLDQQLSEKFHLRIEIGREEREKTSEKLNSLIPNNFISLKDDRFLLQETILALSMKYQFHPLMEGKLIFDTDIKNNFYYFISKLNFSLNTDLESSLFILHPIHVSKTTKIAGQKILVSEVGLNLNYYF